jgi:hypothetical protein
LGPAASTSVTSDAGITRREAFAGKTKSFIAGASVKFGTRTERPAIGCRLRIGRPFNSCNSCQRSGKSSRNEKAPSGRVQRPNSCKARRSFTSTLRLSRQGAVKEDRKRVRGVAARALSLFTQPRKPMHGSVFDVDGITRPGYE